MLIEWLSAEVNRLHNTEEGQAEYKAWKEKRKKMNELEKKLLALALEGCFRTYAHKFHDYEDGFFCEHYYNPQPHKDIICTLASSGVVQEEIWDNVLEITMDLEDWATKGDSEDDNI